ALRKHSGDLDVHSDEIALVVFEMPRRIRAPGADDDGSPLEDLFQLAACAYLGRAAVGPDCAARCWRRRRARRWSRAASRRAVARARYRQLTGADQRPFPGRDP